jgi:hypothetical protein
MSRDNLEQDPRMCPIVESALFEAGLHNASPEDRAALIAFAEHAKSNAAWQIIELCLVNEYGPELIGQAIVRLHTGEPMPGEWHKIEPELRTLIESAILKTGKGV